MTQNSTVEYSYRKNMGNYEHAELKISGTFKDREDRQEVVADLIEFVGQALDQSGPFAKKAASKPATAKSEPKEQPKEEDEKPSTKAETTKTASKAKGDSNESAKGKQEESSKEEQQTSSKKDGDKKEESKNEQKAENKGKRGINKNTKYDRKLDAHRNLFGSFLDECRPNWREKSVVSKASAVSAELHEEGVDFLDPQGNILDSFMETFLTRLDAALEG